MVTPLSVRWRRTGDANVFRDEVSVDCDRGRRSFAGRGDHLRAWIAGVAGDPHAGDGCLAGCVDGGEARLVELAAERREQAVPVRVERGADEDRGPRDAPSVGELHGGQTIVDDREPFDEPVDDLDAARCQAPRARPR